MARGGEGGGDRAKGQKSNRWTAWKSEAADFFYVAAAVGWQIRQAESYLLTDRAGTCAIELELQSSVEHQLSMQ